ncbi:MAG: hypothetical protein J1E36_00495 [Eubacterium sp.]|nr:hypothetical protein [Eubacterium sp.]
MKITIHRGTHQIGGCVTEISSGNDKVFIDFGEDLPGNVSEKSIKPIAGLTESDSSNSALFFTHYHGDHVGRLKDVKAEIPIYMGKTAKALYKTYAARTKSEIIEKIDAIRTFSPLQKITVGNITVTPLMIDHSAFDAYMFIIDADGKRVLHTGDFRLHGFRGNKTLPMLQKYAIDIDIIICEATNLSREDTKIITERDLQNEARKIMQENKYVFVLCSSTNIDRIGAFYHAKPRGRLFICDEYQKLQLEAVRKNHSEYSKLYNFSHVLYYDSNLDERMEKQGFCMIIRQGKMFEQLLKKYKGRSKVIYSMWSGYLKGETRNKELAEFLKDYELTFLHTSGHASTQDLVEFYNTVKPKTGLIPIHGEMPEKFSEFMPNGNIIVLNDEEELFL